MPSKTNSNQFVDVPIFNALVPAEGPKAVPLPLDFTVQQSYLIDLQNAQARGFIKNVQTLFIDNSQNAGALTVVVNQSNQVIICAPLAQGYFPVLAPNPVKLTISCPSGGPNTTVYLLNVPLPAAMWSVASGSNSYSGGKLLVSDALLESAIVSGQMQVLSSLTGSGDAAKTAKVGNRALTGSLTNTSGVLLTGNPGYYLTAAQLILSSLAGISTAGDWTATLTDSSSGAIWTGAFDVPQATGGDTGSTIAGYDLTMDTGSVSDVYFGANTIELLQFTLASAMSIQSIHVAINGPDTVGQGTSLASLQLVGSIYSDSSGSPNSLLGTTTTLVGVVNGDNRLGFATPLSLAAGTYWFGVSNNHIFYYQTDTAHSGNYKSMSGFTPPATASGLSNDSRTSLRSWVIGAASGGGGGGGASVTAVAPLELSTPAGFFWNSQVSTSTLSIVCSAPLGAGKLTYNLSYGTTSQVG